jgi:hypothetical protein
MGLSKKKRLDQLFMLALCKTAYRILREVFGQPYELQSFITVALALAQGLDLLHDLHFSLALRDHGDALPALIWLLGKSFIQEAGHLQIALIGDSVLLADRIAFELTTVCIISWWQCWQVFKQADWEPSLASCRFRLGPSRKSIFLE